MGPTAVDLLATVLAYDDARGTPVANAPHSGYQRLDAGNTAFVDGYGAAAADRAEPGSAAGCLSFELSWKQHRLVINCGLPAVNRETWRQVARATAAHSTIAFNTSRRATFSNPVRSAGWLSGTPIVAGPQQRTDRARGHRERPAAAHLP